MINLDKKVETDINICIVGLGYVGLPTAVFFAEKGFNIIGVDKNPEKIKLIKKGISTIKELKLDSRISKLIKESKLNVTTDLINSTIESDIIIIVVPTPVNKSKDPDLSYIISAGREISKGLQRNKLVILESTVYPGVTEEILQPILESSGLKAGSDFGLAYCPERYNPGDENHTIQNVSRLVGGITPEWAEITRKLYQTIIKEEIKVLKNIKTTEAAKVIENTQRDLNIALMNELAMIFEKLDIDIMEVIEGASTKWNFNAYYPGAGVGGHCLPVDLEKDIYNAIDGADVLVLVTAHDEFKNIDFKKAKKLMKTPIFIDGRRIYDPQKIKEMGFHYRGIGAINH